MINLYTVKKTDTGNYLKAKKTDGNMLIGALTLESVS
jgi:hypothetical protein